MVILVKYVGYSLVQLKIIIIMYLSLTYKTYFPTILPCRSNVVGEHYGTDEVRQVANLQSSLMLSSVHGGKTRTILLSLIFQIIFCLPVNDIIIMVIISFLQQHRKTGSQSQSIVTIISFSATDALNIFLFYITIFNLKR